MNNKTLQKPTGLARPGFRRLLATAAFMPLCHQPLSAAPGPSSADAAWQKLSQAVETQKALAGSLDGKSEITPEQATAAGKARAELADALGDFILAFPTDRLRAADAEPDAYEDLEHGIINTRGQAIMAIEKTDPEAAAVAERRLIDGLTDKYPRGGQAYRLTTLVADHLRRLEGIDTARAERVARDFTGSTHPAVRAGAEGWLKLHAEKSKPLELKFTAIDGREVDFAKLRGKVVLLEFTGITWCPACRESEVVLKQLYSKYHDQGLDIAAITYEFNPEDRGKVQDLIRERGLPWPFYFDGLREKNPHVERFQVRGYPTLFVLDRTGRIVASHVRDEELDALIRPLLDEQSSGAKNSAASP